MHSPPHASRRTPPSVSGDPSVSGRCCVYQGIYRGPDGFDFEGQWKAGVRVWRGRKWKDAEITGQVSRGRARLFHLEVMHWRPSPDDVSRLQ